MSPIFNIDELLAEAQERTAEAHATTAAVLLNELIDEWIAKKDSEHSRAALEEFMQTEAYAKLPYNVRNARFITGSKLKTYAELPYVAKLKYEDGIEFSWCDTDAMVRGNALDDLKTRGIAYFNENYIAVDRRTKAGKELAESAAEKGITIISETNRDKILRADEQAQLHPLFPKTWKKRNILWLWGNKYPCKAELDNFIPHERIDDLKFTGNIVTFSPMRYLAQQAFYFQAVLERDMEKLPARLCVVDAGTDFSCAHAWEFDVKSLEGHQREVSRLLHAYVDSMESGIWPDLGNSNAQDILEVYWKSDYYPVLPNRFASEPTKL